MNRVVVTRGFMGICGMQVCAVKDATDEEVLEVCNRENPAGTEKGWMQVARDNHPDEAIRPVTCLSDPERLHLIAIC